jgi:SAM-dependent methyltransferase
MTREEKAPAQAADKISAEIARMRASDVHAHWQDWAVRYGTDLRATTLTSSIKRLEVAALARTIKRVIMPSSIASILEIGCGNGQNIVALAKIFAQQGFSWYGIDYIQEMVDAAQKNAAEHGLSQRTHFARADLRGDTWGELPAYDVIFSDRALINLSSLHEQTAAIDAIHKRLNDHGALIMIENSRQTKDIQNDLREALGLSRRKDADFNLFFDDTVIVPHLKSLFGTVEIEDFGSLHDIILYALLPHAMKAEFQYDHPIMASVAELCERIPIPCGPFGQNRLYFCRR